MGLRHRLALAATRAALRVPEPLLHFAADRLGAAARHVDGRSIDGVQRLGCAVVQWSDPPEDDDIDAFRKRVRLSTLGLGPEPLPREHCQDLNAGGVPCRIYRPPGLSPRPRLVVFFHGGGGVLGDLNMYNGVCSGLARQARCVVASVDYRLAPEARFPAGLDDCERAYRELRERTGKLGCDPNWAAVAGDSMGGNLAASVVQRCVDAPPDFAWLAYPWMDLRVQAPSTRTLREGYGLTTSAISWFRAQYLGPDATEDTVVQASPGLGSPDGFCPTFLFTAGFDPLRDEGRRFAHDLERAGGDVEYRCFDGQVHGFLSVAGAVPAAHDAFLEAVAPLAGAVLAS